MRYITTLCSLLAAGCVNSMSIQGPKVPNVIVPFICMPSPENIKTKKIYSDRIILPNMELVQTSSVEVKNDHVRFCTKGDVMKRILVLTLSLLFCQLSMADGEAQYKYREGVMKTVGGQMASMAAVLRGQVHFDNLAFHARGMADLARIVPDIYPEGSGVGPSSKSSGSP